MTTIKDLKTIDLKKIPDQYKNLIMGIEQLIDDYDKESDKALFEQEAKANIDAYYDMVKSVASDAISSVTKKEKKTGNKEAKIQGKHRNILLEYHNALLDLAINYEAEESNELEGILKNTLDELNEIQEDESEQKIPISVQKALEPFYAFVKGLESNQKIRLGTVDETDVSYRDKAVKITDKLLKDLGVKSTQKVHTKERSKSKKDKEEIKLRTITSNAVSILNDLAIDLDGEDEDILATTRFELDDVLDQPEDSIFIKGVKQAVANYEEQEGGISDKKTQKAADSEIQKIKDELKRLEKEKKEKAEKSKKVLEKVKAYDQDIAACRAVIREYNKKKKEGQPEKPKPTRRTLLKKKVLSIVKLTPEALASEPAVQEENRKIVKSTIRAFMKNWGMNSTHNAQQVEKAIDKEFDELADKIEEKEQKSTAHRWSRDLPDTDKIIAFEKKHSKHILEEVALQIVDHITTAIGLYKTDKAKAFEHLRDHLNNPQIEAYLPDYIVDEMKIKPLKSKSN